MLDPWIIEEIRKREEERRRDQEAGRVLEHPLESPPYHERGGQQPVPPTEEVERGVVVIDM